MLRFIGLVLWLRSSYRYLVLKFGTLSCCVLRPLRDRLHFTVEVLKSETFPQISKVPLQQPISQSED